MLKSLLLLVAAYAGYKYAHSASQEGKGNRNVYGVNKLTPHSAPGKAPFYSETFQRKTPAHP